MNLEEMESLQEDNELLNVQIPGPDTTHLARDHLV